MNRKPLPAMNNQELIKELQRIEYKARAQYRRLSGSREAKVQLAGKSAVERYEKNIPYMNVGTKTLQEELQKDNKFRQKMMKRISVIEHWMKGKNATVTGAREQFKRAEGQLQYFGYDTEKMKADRIWRMFTGVGMAPEETTEYESIQDQYFTIYDESEGHFIDIEDLLIPSDIKQELAIEHRDANLHLGTKIFNKMAYERAQKRAELKDEFDIKFGDRPYF